MKLPVFYVFSVEKLQQLSHKFTVIQKQNMVDLCEQIHNRTFFLAMRIWWTRTWGTSWTAPRGRGRRRRRTTAVRFLPRPQNSLLTLPTRFLYFSLLSRVADPDPVGHKWPTKVGKNSEISCFEVLDVLFWKLKASFVTWTSFMEA